MTVVEFNIPFGYGLFRESKYLCHLTSNKNILPTI